MPSRHSAMPARRFTGLLLGLGSLLTTGLLTAAPPVTATAAPVATTTPAAAPIEDLAVPVPATTCEPFRRAGVTALGRTLSAAYPKTGYRVTRLCDAPALDEQRQGRVLSWRVSAAKAAQVKQARTMLTGLLGTDAAGHRYAGARRLGVTRVVWDDREWRADAPDAGWQAYSTCATRRSSADDARCGRSTMQIALSWPGALAKTSYWTGKVAATDFGPCRPADLSWGYRYDQRQPRPCPTYPPLALPRTATKADHDLVAWSGVRLLKGSTGEPVRVLQRALRVRADGRFSASTRTSLRTWQRKHGVAASGKTDGATWRALLSATLSVPMTTTPSGATSTVPPTTTAPPTTAPSAAPTTTAPSAAPTTTAPTAAPTTTAPTAAPTKAAPTAAPTTTAPTAAPTTTAPSAAPTKAAPSAAPTTTAPVVLPTAAPTTTAPVVPPTTPPTTAPPTSTMPLTSSGDWRRIYSQDFVAPAPVGSFVTAKKDDWYLQPSHPYANALRTYPDGWGTTGNLSLNYPSKTTDVVTQDHDALGVFRMRAHTETVDGQQRSLAGSYFAVIDPTASGSAQTAQTYGRYSVRFRTVGGYPTQGAGARYGSAFLLWPADDTWSEGEVDFPEMAWGGKVGGYVHTMGNPQVNAAVISSPTTTEGGWHVATIEWRPDALVFSLDGQVLQTVTHDVPTKPFRWGFQSGGHDGTPASGVEGQLLIDWITIDAWTGRR